VNSQVTRPGTLLRLVMGVAWLIVSGSFARLLIGQTGLVSAGLGGAVLVAALIALILAWVSVRVEEPRYLAISTVAALATLAVAVVLMALRAAHETGVAMAVGASVAAATSYVQLRAYVRLRACVEPRAESPGDGRGT
jgi:hypothetical protein